MFGKKKVVFLTVISLAFALVMANFVAFSVAAPAANAFSETAGSPPVVAEDWTMTEVVSTESTSWSESPSLAVGPDGTVHITWHDYTDYGGSGTDMDIFYKRFEPGSGWTSTEVVSTESTDQSSSPSLAVGSDGKVHIAWDDSTDYDSADTDFDIFYKRFEPGSGWTTTEVVSTESTDACLASSLAVGPDGTVHIAWMEWTDYGGSGTDYDIFYKRFEPGSGWTTTEVVSTESTDHSFRPSVGVGSDGKVHIAWDDSTDYGGSGGGIFYKRFEPGSGWTLTEVVSTESTDGSVHPSLAVGSDGKVHITWEDYTDYGGSGTDEDIFYKRFVPGVGFTMTEVVSTESTGISWYPSLGVGSDGTVHIAWMDFTNYGGSSPDCDIFYKRFEQVVGWTLTEVVSTESTDKSWYPSLGVGSDGTVHIAWEDETAYDGSGADNDIFYKRFEFPEPPPPPEPVYQYNFKLNPFTDVFHMNLTDGGWLKGIDTTPGYTVPLLGKYECGRAYIAVDLPAGGIEMCFVVISASSGAGAMMRIMDDLSLVGPETVWLTAASGAAQFAAGPTLAEAAGREVAAETLYEVLMKPFDDVLFLETELAPWLWGWAEAAGPSYPAPVLGLTVGGRFYFAMDYIDGAGLQELALVAGSTSTRKGAIVRSSGGFIYEDPTPIWLEMA